MIKYKEKFNEIRKDLLQEEKIEIRRRQAEERLNFNWWKVLVPITLTVILSGMFWGVIFGIYYLVADDDPVIPGEQITHRIQKNDVSNHHSSVDKDIANLPKKSRERATSLALKVDEKVEVVESKNFPELGAVKICNKSTACWASSTLNPAKRYGCCLAKDRKNNTAWCEGKEDDGIGEWVAFEISPKRKSIQLVPGYIKSKKIYYANNRVKEATVQVVDGVTNPINKVKLKDQRKFQKITLPNFDTSKLKKGEKIKVRVTINSIYKGTKYRDTCISEIK